VAVTIALAAAPSLAVAANGCGPAGFGLLVPDRPFGFDFREACERHDDCYVTPWREVDTTPAQAKERCDAGFLGDLDESCLAEPALSDRRLDLCLDLASDYYRAVRTWLGALAYARAQRW
jgi:Prokaryotic phospholipase A2